MERLKKGIDFYDAIFILVCIICTILLSSSLKNIKYYDGADEGFYLQYATVVNENGLAAFPGIFENYISHSQMWVFPNPLRIAFILLSALWVNLFGLTYLSLSSLSLFCYLLALGASYYFGQKYFGKRAALLFSILLAFSPLNMAMARRALVDSTSNLFLILSIWLFFDMLNDRRTVKYSIFVVVYTLAILTKEPSILLTPVFAVYLIIRRYALKKEYYLNDFLCVCFYPIIIAGSVYLFAANSLSSVFQVIRIILASPSANKYAVLYCAGPWFRYIIDYILLSPWTCILAIGYFFSIISSRDYQENILYFLVIFAFYFLLLNVFAKNVRYAMLLDMPLRIFSVSMILKIMEVRFAKFKYSHIFAFALVIAIAVYDCLSFYKFFIINDIYDPVSFLLLRARQFLPII